MSESGAEGRTIGRATSTPVEGEPDAEAPARARHLHQRVAGAALRAGALTLGPVAVGLLVVAAGARWTGLFVATAAALSASFLVFLLERRDARWFEVLGRAAAAGLVGSVLAFAAALCVEHAGAPDQALAALSRTLRRAADVLGVALASALLAPVWGVLLLVRARTTRAGPQALAGALTGVPLLVALEVDGHGGRGGLALLALTAGGGLGGLLLAHAERLLGPRVDPAARPPAERGVARLLWTWALLTLLGLVVAVPSLIGGHDRCCGEGAMSAIGALKSIHTAQALFSQADKDGDGVADFAPCVADLAAPAHGSLVDPILGTGTKRNYTFTVVRDEANPTTRWCATADPIRITDFADRRFWIDQAGQVYYAKADTTPAVTPDPTTGPPAGWTVLGR